MGEKQRCRGQGKVRQEVARMEEMEGKKGTIKALEGERISRTGGKKKRKISPREEARATATDWKEGGNVDILLGLWQVFSC